MISRNAQSKDVFIRYQALTASVLMMGNIDVTPPKVSGRGLNPDESSLSTQPTNAGQYRVGPTQKGKPTGDCYYEIAMVTSKDVSFVLVHSNAKVKAAPMFRVL